jgi:hypothetical protein
LDSGIWFYPSGQKLSASTNVAALKDIFHLPLGATMMKMLSDGRVTPWR